MAAFRKTTWKNDKTGFAQTDISRSGELPKLYVLANVAVK